MRRAAVVGTGTMGPGLGATLARGGLRVALYDSDPTALERARQGVVAAEHVLDDLAGPQVDGGGVTMERDLDRKSVV